QHFTDPLSSRAQVDVLPTVTAVAVRPVPSDTAGRLSPISPGWSPRDSLSPRPSGPLMLYPQHFRELSSRMAHVWKLPALASRAIAVRPVPRSTTGRASPISPGWSTRAVVSPVPRRPSVPVPQHLT